MSGELNWSIADIYPGSAIWQTKELSNIDSEDEEVLSEDAEKLSEIEHDKASKKSIYMGVAFILLLVIFFSVGK